MANKNELLEQAGRLGYEFERDFGGCSQCVLAAIRNTAGNIPDEVFKAATGLAGGIGLQGHACGALTGGCLALGCYYGRDYDHFNDPDGIRFNTFRLCEKLVNKFKEEYGSPDCHAIQTKLMGRSYLLSNKGEHTEYIEAGGHDDKCTMVCGKAAQWVLEILDEEGLLK